MSQAIRILNSETINQIAAGEVLERPAHLVKELVENSLDAASSEIEVDLADGGRTLIVRDNGHGIEEKDLPLAFARHATSKIQSAHDLWTLSSFGFRGEALASLAAVAEVTLTSRTAQRPLGSRILIRYGESSQVEQIAARPGTVIEVRNLFANVPARRKFLKSDAAELGQARRVLKALALGYPEVTFRLLDQGRLIQHWMPAKSLVVRAQNVLEQETLYFAEGEHEGMTVRAAYSSPMSTVGTSQQIWIFAQNRWIQDRSLQAAVMESFRTLLMHGEFPICVVQLHVPPENIDVNIHPTKSQLKFQNPQSVFRAVHRTLRAALERAPWIPRPAATLHSTPLSPSLTPSFQPSHPSSNTLAHETSIETTRTSPASLEIQRELNMAHATQFAQKQWVAQELSVDGSVSTPMTANLPLTNTQLWSRLQILGQSNLTYILAQSGTALFLVDQHAAHERVMFERISHQYRAQTVESQTFLVPLTLKFEVEACEAILENAKALESLGMNVEQIGPTTLALQSAPAFIKESSLPRMLERLAREQIEFGARFSFERIVNDLLATMACHSAIRAGQALSRPEMSALLVEMDAHPLSSFCPHGRPVYVEWPFVRLDREFGRLGV